MNDKGNIIIYQTKDGQTLIDVRLENETVWINRQQMAELFDRDVKTIGKHITNALKEELKEIPTSQNLRQFNKRVKEALPGSRILQSRNDGNKRIAAFLFLWFLEKNRILYKPDGSRLISNNTLVALTLMIAESRTEEKDIMVKVVINLINQNN